MCLIRLPVAERTTENEVVCDSLEDQRAGIVTTWYTVFAFAAGRPRDANSFFASENELRTRSRAHASACV